MTNLRSNKEAEIDEEFLRQIDQVEDLLPTTLDKLDDDTLICECFCVSVRDIRLLCETKVDLQLLQEDLHLGQGCTTCLKNIDSWIHRIF